MKIISQLLETINRIPEQIALVEGSRKLTYRQLDEITQQVAGYLLDKGIKKNEVVTVETADRFEAICLMLGVVRAGGAYCVIPMDYPESRKEKMRAKIHSVLQLQSLQEIREVQGKAGVINGEREEDSLLYIIFTSGSTGEPKAVGIQDKAIEKIVSHAPFYEGKVIGQFAPLEFDASIYEVFGGLLNGLTIQIVYKDDSLDTDIIPELFEELDMVFLTTRLFNLYVDECPTAFQQLSLVLTGGERGSLSHLKEAGRYCRVMHVYGPTETTVFATSYEIHGKEQELPIGRSFADYGQLLILNEAGEAVKKTGEQGELYIHDGGLMKGYIGDPTATEKVMTRFEGIAFYKTGDIVYQNEENELVYIERKDRQVKVSGFRIELGEIEKNAKTFGLEKDCLAHYDGKHLNLFIQDSIDLSELRTYLRSKLPGYMIPVIKKVDYIPMNKNGKTDMEAMRWAN
ncbi:AMP-binding protein [Enterococcus sp. LJL98]